jgi:hypothetical protein
MDQNTRSRSRTGGIVLTGGQIIVQGTQTTRALVRAEVGDVPAIGSLYLSTAGKLYLKVANAAADTDWQRVTTTAAD